MYLPSSNFNLRRVDAVVLCGALFGLFHLSVAQFFPTTGIPLLFAGIPMKFRCSRKATSSCSTGHTVASCLTNLLITGSLLLPMEKLFESFIWASRPTLASHIVETAGTENGREKRPGIRRPQRLSILCCALPSASPLFNSSMLALPLLSVLPCCEPLFLFLSTYNCSFRRM